MRASLFIVVPALAALVAAKSVPSSSSEDQQEASER